VRGDNVKGGHDDMNVNSMTAKKPAV
jgi:hypothetical protein